MKNKISRRSVLQLGAIAVGSTTFSMLVGGEPKRPKNASREKMDAHRINELTSSPESKSISGPLSEWPKIPRGLQKATFLFADGRKKVIEHKGREWAVEEKYLVAVVDMGDEGIMKCVTVHDPTANVFRRWLLFPDGAVTESIGLMDPSKRSIAWNGKFGNDRFNYLSIETMEGKRTRWVGRTFLDGNLYMSEEGTGEPLE